MRRRLGHLLVRHERQGTRVGLAETGQRGDLCLEVAVNGSSHDLMDLGEREWRGELRRTHRVIPFFLVFETAVAVALGFLAESALVFAEDGFGGDGFFAADVGFFEADFLEPALEGAAADFGDSEWAFVDGSASRR